LPEFGSWLLFRVNDLPKLRFEDACRTRGSGGTDFALIESELEVIQKQLWRLPTRRELAGTALGIIFATMMRLLFLLR
jgi:hypothetical protein